MPQPLAGRQSPWWADRWTPEEPACTCSGAKWGEKHLENTDTHSNSLSGDKSISTSTGSISPMNLYTKMKSSVSRMKPVFHTQMVLSMAEIPRKTKIMVSEPLAKTFMTYLTVLTEFSFMFALMYFWQHTPQNTHLHKRHTWSSEQISSSGPNLKYVCFLMPLVANNYPDIWNFWACQFGPFDHRWVGGHTVSSKFVWQVIISLTQALVSVVFGPRLLDDVMQ